MKILTRSMMALFLAMAACGGGDDDMPMFDAPPGNPDASTAPGVSATAAPDTLAADEMTTLTITTTNFILDPAAVGMANEAGHGHYHVYLDNETGANYLAADAAATVMVTIPAGTTAGPHTLKVQLFENDHTPLSPEVSAVVNITIQ